MPRLTLETLKKFKEQLEENGMIIRVQLENTMVALTAIIGTSSDVESDILFLQSELERIKKLPKFINGDTPIIAHESLKIRLVDSLSRVIGFRQDY